MMLEQLLEVIDKSEFDNLSHDIKLSLREHRQWMHKISLSIVSGKALMEQEFCAADAHKHCAFGRWLDKILIDEIFHQGSFLKIERLHRNLHSLGSQLMHQLQEKNKVEPNTYKEFLDIQKELFDLVLLIFEFTVVNQHQFDHTTKLMTRRSADAILAHEKHRLARFDDYNCIIALADLDHFKRINDRFGHHVGDKVLEVTAEIFNSILRRHDTVARYGGEEFLFIIPGASLRDVSNLIERTRLCLANTDIKVDGLRINITSSFGVTPLSAYEEFKESIKRADKALYKAKEAGRNKVVVFDMQANSLVA